MILFINGPFISTEIGTHGRTPVEVAGQILESVAVQTG
jgi:hypothetical protein